MYQGAAQLLSIVRVSLSAAGISQLVFADYTCSTMACYPGGACAFVRVLVQSSKPDCCKPIRAARQLSTPGQFSM